jgi:BirA family biotin operon repressor/biotin-[acetyl-CoA-carboxylase] ligase
VPGALSAALAAVAARAGRFGSPVVYLAQTPSTNDAAAELAGAGAPEGTLVVARLQTRGRGRQGHEWFSPAEAGLYFSLVMRPGGVIPPSRTALLTLAAGIAVVQGVGEACGFVPTLKWPNDVVVGRAGDASPRLARKLAGILAEGATLGSDLQHVVVGIGINVKSAVLPGDLQGRVTSLEEETGRRVEPYAVLAAVVSALAERYADLALGRQSLVLDEWRRHAPSAAGAPVLVRTPAGAARGVTAGLQADGALAVEVQGTVVSMNAGEVQWL